MMNVLIAYATVHGSTAQVASFVGDVLSSKGLDVHVANAKEVLSVKDYDALILGSPIHSGAWLPEITAFIEGFNEEWATKPVYMWVNCIRVLEQFGEEHARDYYLNSELLKLLDVRQVAVFPGKLDLEATDWQERWTLAARYDGHTWPSGFDGDFRDWDKVRTWAGEIAEELLAVKTT
jgi:menaquinone-dependent protoporphyrinogen oxidase